MHLMILDDHPLVRHGIRMVVSTENNIHIVGEAANPSEALELMSSANPGLVLVDLNLGGDNGLEFIRHARKNKFQCKYIVLTSSATSEQLRMAQELGVEGICLKEALPEDLLYAIDVVSRGRKYYDPVCMEALMETTTPSYSKPALDELTPKEFEVLLSLGKGRSNKEIASEFHITEFTVKKHVSQILSKLSLTDRTQAALFALSHGLVEFELSPS
ncbi:response regulator transcription factor [Paenibacillus lemnae]|uniref:Response regulator transcription factor n=1 Tax=Paenibacillus lemnae TaxID=1330551 RepID=A0A848M337_PAELE|nr:response regulator transcription factor [Paenibacillus lemnae]